MRIQPPNTLGSIDFFFLHVHYLLHKVYLKKVIKVKKFKSIVYNISPTLNQIS